MPEPGRRSLEKGLAAVVVGLVSAAVLIIGLEPVLRQLYPGLDVGAAGSPERRMVGSMPGATYLLLWMLYALASLVGGLASSLIAGRARSWPALLTGGILMVAGTFGVLTVHQPLWFRLATFLAYPMAYAGHLAARKTA